MKCLGPLVFLVLVASGCAEETAIDIRLAPDLNINTEDELRGAVASLLLVVDSDEGLYLAGEERTSGSVQIENADSDLEFLEVVAAIAWDGEDLPLIRLAQGTLPDHPLTLKVFGLPAEPGSPVAFGQVRGVRLTSPPQEVVVPLNLRSDMRPPRVTEVLPTNGAPIAGCGLDSMAVVFSKPVDEESLAGAFELSPSGTIEEVTLDETGLIAQLRVAVSSENPLLSFRLRIANSVTDVEGNALDQVPSQEGDQGFDDELSYACGPPSMTPEEPCGAMFPDFGDCEFPDRFQCVEGECTLYRCGDAMCDEGSACSSTTFLCEPTCSEEMLCLDGECTTICV